MKVAAAGGGQPTTTQSIDDGSSAGVCETVAKSRDRHRFGGEIAETTPNAAQ